jgi:hypothetical protein
MLGRICYLEQQVEVLTRNVVVLMLIVTAYTLYKLWVLERRWLKRRSEKPAASTKDVTGQWESDDGPDQPVIVPSPKGRPCQGRVGSVSARGGRSEA